MKTGFKYLIIFSLMFPQLVSGQRRDSLKELERRVTTLEDYKTALDKLYEANVTTLKSDVKEDVQKSKEALSKDINELKRTYTIFTYIGLPVTFIALASMILGIRRYVRSKITERIESVVEEKREDIIRIVQSQEFENRIRLTKKILVLSPNEADQDIIKSIISKLKFKAENVKYRINIGYVPSSDHDLIIFNNCNGNFKQDLINKYISEGKEDEAFVAYTTQNLDRHPNLNFSNSPYTLYSSIITTLKYQEILRIIN